jgi:hypothetical protein
MKINNVPNYTKEYGYIVARYVDGEWWFWGAFETIEEAVRVAQEVNSHAFNMVDVDF